jgi:hypothetical protein
MHLVLNQEGWNDSNLPKSLGNQPYLREFNLRTWKLASTYYGVNAIALVSLRIPLNQCILPPAPFPDKPNDTNTCNHIWWYTHAWNHGYTYLNKRNLNTQDFLGKFASNMSFMDGNAWAWFLDENYDHIYCQYTATAHGEDSIVHFEANPILAYVLGWPPNQTNFHDGDQQWGIYHPNFETWNGTYYICIEELDTTNTFNVEPEKELYNVIAAVDVNESGFTSYPQEINSVRKVYFPKRQYASWTPQRAPLVQLSEPTNITQLTISVYRDLHGRIVPWPFQNGLTFEFMFVTNDTKSDTQNPNQY